MCINNKKRLAFKSGFTLIELIVTIAIMGIVIAMAYSIGDFGNRSFNNGSVKSDIQSDTRLAANYITKELRYSSNAEILPSLPADKGTSKKYIYVENGILKQYYNGSTTNIIGSTSNNTIATLQFIIQNSKTVDFNIQETSKNQTFTLSSTILLLNIGVNILTNQTGPVISYSNDTVVTNITAPYTDQLALFEKNMFNVIGDNAEINFNSIHALSLPGSILMQGIDLSISGMRGNLNANMAIKAQTLNLGTGQLGTAGGKEVMLDVNVLTGSLDTYNPNFYVNHNIFVPRPSKIYNSSQWSEIKDYPGGFWTSFINKGDGHMVPMLVKGLKDNIDLDLSNKSINPALDIKKIHYFNGIVTNNVINNKITDNKLPDYKGNICTADTYKGGYEFIICHGPLVINTTDKLNGKFNFTGIIYCDSVVTFNDVDSNFNGIIIATGLESFNKIGTNVHNWNVQYNNNNSDFNGDINSFNTTLVNITN